MVHTCDAQLLDSGDRWLRQMQRPTIALEVRVRAGEDVQHQTGAAGTWHWQVEEPAYNNSVTMMNGTTVQIGRR